MKQKNTIKKPFNVMFLLLFILLCLYALSMFILLGWGLMKSVQPVKDFINSGVKASSIPQSITFENYINSFQNIKYQIPLSLGGGTVYFAEMFTNSIVYAVGCAALGVLCDCSVAYLTTKIKMKFNAVIEFIVYFKMLVPLYGTMPAMIKLVTGLGVIDSFLGVFMMAFFFGGPNYLIFKAAFKGLSNEYIEAALMDGASQFRIMFQICFPLVKTIIGIVFITYFITRWNDYMTPLIYLRKNPTAAYGLYTFNRAASSYEDYVVNKVAGFFIMVIPTFIIFLCMKDKLMGNLTMGGVKG